MIAFCKNCAVTFLGRSGGVWIAYLIDPDSYADWRFYTHGKASQVSRPYITSFALLRRKALTHFILANKTIRNNINNNNQR